MPLAYHTCLRRQDGGVLARNRRELVPLLRSVLTQGWRGLDTRRDPPLVVFGFGDHHVHLMLDCDELEAIELCRRLAISFSRSLSKPRDTSSPAVVRSFLKPINSGRHLYSTFRYVLLQPERHGADVDPSCEATALPDLLDLRPLGRYLQAPVRQLLPRVDTAALLRLVGVSALGPEIGEPNADDVMASVLAATALSDLHGRQPEVRRARRIALHLLSGRLPLTRIAGHLGVGRTTLHELRRIPIDDDLLRAVVGQLGLRRRFGERRATVEGRAPRKQGAAIDAPLLG